jgi:hypothetical protein
MEKPIRVITQRRPDPSTQNHATICTDSLDKFNVSQHLYVTY